MIDGDAEVVVDVVPREDGAPGTDVAAGEPNARGMVTVQPMAHTGEQCVFLNEERVVPVHTDDDRALVLWLRCEQSHDRLADGARRICSIYFTVKFDDVSVVQIHGKGVGASLGQVDEGGCKSVIDDGEMWWYDRQRKILARVPRAKNRIYPITLSLATSVDASWPATATRLGVGMLDSDICTWRSRREGDGTWLADHTAAR